VTTYAYVFLRVRWRKAAGNKSRERQVFINVKTARENRLRRKTQPVMERIAGQPGVEARKSPRRANE
jgi:hypothetical protein